MIDKFQVIILASLIFIFAFVFKAELAEFRSAEPYRRMGGNMGRRGNMGGYGNMGGRRNMGRWKRSAEPNRRMGCGWMGCGKMGGGNMGRGGMGR